MGLFEARGQIDRGLKDLMFRWSMARTSWRDNVAAEFEEQELLPLQNHVRNAASAMTLAAGLVAKIRSDCADR